MTNAAGPAPSPVDPQALEADLARASQALSGFADGAGAQSIDRLSARFRALGEDLSGTLERAANRGQLSFQRLAAGIAGDLARIAAQEVLSGLLGGGSSQGTTGPSQNFTLNFSGQASPSAPFRGAGQIAAGVLRALNTGARFG